MKRTGILASIAPAGAPPPCMKRIHRMPQEIALTGLSARL